MNTQTAVDLLTDLFDSRGYIQVFIQYSETDTVTDLPYASKFSGIYTELNDAKKGMDTIQPKKMHTLRKLVYPYNTLTKYIKAEYVTNAWLKTYEMFVTEKIVHKTNKYIAFFNANAPGTSSMAFEYYMNKFHMDTCMDWVASSLIGDGALTDTYGIIHDTKEKWLMHENNNGDVTDIKNILDFKDQLHNKFGRGVDLYFSDIGIEATNFDLEEHNEIKEVLGQNITGLLTLKTGGILITKQRNFITPFNISMLSFYSSKFKSFSIVKPKTSRALNSEVYIIGKGYIPVTEQEKATLFNILLHYDKQVHPYIIPLPISITAAKCILHATKLIICETQMKYIRILMDLNNISKIEEVYERIAPVIQRLLNEFMVSFYLKK